PQGTAQPGPRLGEAWYRLAEALRALNDDEGSQTAYRRSIEWDTPKQGGSGRHAYRARYQLAQADQRRGKLDSARETLEQNLRLLRTAGDDRDAEAKEKTLYALGDICFSQRALEGTLSRAIYHLEAALEEFPDSAEALHGRYLLAESYRLLADKLG